jgi:hypothetical protein
VEGDQDVGTERRTKGTEKQKNGGQKVDEDKTVVIEHKMWTTMDTGQGETERRREQHATQRKYAKRAWLFTCNADIFQATIFGKDFLELLFFCLR